MKDVLRTNRNCLRPIHLVLPFLVSVACVSAPTPDQVDPVSSSSSFLTTTLEAESLTRTASAIGSNVVTDANASGTGYAQLNTGSVVNDWIELTIPGLTAGTYNFTVFFKSNTNRGINQARLDGTNLGATCDQYRASAQYGLSCALGSRTLAAGNHTLRFTLTGKNAASSGYTITIDKIVLVSNDAGTGGTVGTGGGPGTGGIVGTGGGPGTGGVVGTGGTIGTGGTVGTPATYEAENLTRTASAVGSSVANDAAASGGAYAQLAGVPAVGAWIEFTLTGVTAGTYDVTMYFKSNTNRGINQAALDGVTLGQTCDEYRTSTQYNLSCIMGRAFLAAGNHQLRFTVTGKNAASTAYTTTVDKIVLTPVGGPGGTGGSMGTGGVSGSGGSSGTGGARPLAFGPAMTFAAGNHAHAARLADYLGNPADFNGDGKTDMVVVNAADANVSILLGNGDGNLQGQVRYAVKAASEPKAVVIGDLNRDGFLDLVTANQASPGTVSVLLGNGNGTFRTKVDYNACTGSHEPALGDFNKDGNPDIVVAGHGESSACVLLGTGTGTFQTVKKYANGAGPHSVTVADFNGDGWLDFATANLSSSNAGVFINNKTGGFTVAYFGTGSGPHSIRSADLNRDGFIDLVSANQNSNNVSVLLGNGNGTFRGAVNYGTDQTPKGLAVADMDGDGVLDILSANIWGNYPNLVHTGGDTVNILLGTGTGTFKAKAAFTVGTGPFSVAAEDVNSDGKLDFITANWWNANVTVRLAQ